MTMHEVLGKTELLPAGAAPARAAVGLLRPPTMALMGAMVGTAMALMGDMVGLTMALLCWGPWWGPRCRLCPRVCSFCRTSTIADSLGSTYVKKLSRKGLVVIVISIKCLYIYF